jgi:hypothetical protein
MTSGASVANVGATVVVVVVVVVVVDLPFVVMIVVVLTLVEVQSLWMEEEGGSWIVFGWGMELMEWGGI